MCSGFHWLTDSKLVGRFQLRTVGCFDRNGLLGACGLIIIKKLIIIMKIIIHASKYYLYDSVFVCLSVYEIVKQ